MYFVEYGLTERVTFDTIEQMNIFTAGLGFKGESFTCGNVKDVAKLNKNYSDTPKLLKNQMLYSKDANCIYYIDEQYPDELMFIPLAKDGTFTLDDSGAVDYEMMKGEQVNDNLTFDELYDTVRKSLVGQGGK